MRQSAVMAVLPRSPNRGSRASSGLPCFRGVLRVKKRGCRRVDEVVDEVSAPVVGNAESAGEIPEAAEGLAVSTLVLDWEKWNPNTAGVEADAVAERAGHA